MILKIIKKSKIANGHFKSVYTRESWMEPELVRIGFGFTQDRLGSISCPC